MLDGRAATVLAGGHTHLQMLRQHRGMFIVNPGSVGMPFVEKASGRSADGDGARRVRDGRGVGRRRRRGALEARAARIGARCASRRRRATSRSRDWLVAQYADPASA